MYRAWLNLLMAPLAVVMLMTGCSTTERVTRRSQLANPYATGPIAVLMKNGTQYRLENYRLDDSTLQALSGSFEFPPDGTGARGFQGEIPLRDIAIVQTSSTSFGKALFGIGVTAVFVGAAISYLGGDNSFRIGQQVRYVGPMGGGGGESCPSIYSWNGGGYVLEGEAFGTALGKALETDSWIALPSLTVSHGVLKLRVANERAETHFVNSVRLVAAEVNSGETLCVGSDGTLWPLAHLTAPVSAVERGGKNILPQVISRDGKYWQSDVVPPSPSDDFTDELLVRFVKPEGGTAGSVSLVLTAINTDLSAAAFSKICGYLGSQTLDFMKAIEQDPEMIASLRWWKDQSRLRVSAWNGRDWVNIGEVTPEATAVPFARLVRFSTTIMMDDTAVIRLESLRDVWKIDAIQVDWTPAQPLQVRPVRLISAVGPEGDDVAASIASGDDQHVVLLPPETMNLTFEPIRPSPKKKVVYAVNVAGYLHEWIPQAKDTSIATVVSLIPSAQRLEFLKLIFRNKGVLLPAIYSEWYTLRRQLESR